MRMGRGTEKEEGRKMMWEPQDVRKVGRRVKGRKGTPKIQVYH